MKLMLRSWSALALTAALATAYGTGASAQALPDLILALEPVTGMRLVYGGAFTPGPPTGKPPDLPQRIEEVLRVDSDSLELRVSEGERSAIFRLSRSGNVLQVLTPEGRPLSQSGDDLAHPIVVHGPRVQINEGIYRAWRVGEKQQGVSNSPQGIDTVLRSTAENTYRGTDSILGRMAARFEVNGETATVFKGQVFDIRSWEDLTIQQLVAQQFLAWVPRTRIQGTVWIDVRTGFLLRSSGTWQGAGQKGVFDQVLDLEKSRLNLMP
jgi:hypothetical protein